MGVLTPHELTEFLAAFIDQPDAPQAQSAAIQHAVAAIHAEAAAIVTGDTVTATIGFPAGPLPVTQFLEVSAGTRPILDVPGMGRYTVATVPIGAYTPYNLILARAEARPFTIEEICLIRAMAQVLGLSLQALRTLESERRDADDNERLVDTLQERQRLLEVLANIQRAITRRAPLQQILDAITSSLQDLLGVEMAALNLLDSDDPTLLTMHSSRGLPADVVAAARRVPIKAAGISGLAIAGNELVSLDNCSDAPIALAELTRDSLTQESLQAAMAAPVHDNGATVGCLVVGSYQPGRTWEKTDQEILTAFAEHVSLAVTDARMLEAMQQAFHDSLTGLASRALFLARMEDSLAAAVDNNTAGSDTAGSGIGSGVAALFIDLDRFKIVNDSLGHAAGDLLLIGVADRIQACLRNGDVAARLGGDEFAVLLPTATSVDEAVPVARRILETLRQPFDLDGKEAFISSSIGIAFSAPGDDDANELMIRADLAMYKAKKHGKDRYEIFEPEMQAVFQANLQLESDLRRAVLRHEFELRYQPIVHLRTGDITGFEALVRWQHPTRGLIPPLEFIPIAEETGMIVAIGEWVLREACRQAAQWNARRGDDKPLTVSVNLSAVQLDQADLPAVVADALAEAGLPAASLVLELTESLLVDHRDSTVRQLHDLKALGVRLAIDDFGTGYSSLAYLRRFPVDIIKIDKSFVDDVGDTPAALALTLGIIQLGQALHLSTIAEGIEHAEQLTELTDGNCELGQGYYFAEPLNGADMGDLLFRRIAPADQP